MKRYNSESGFSLVEILVVMVIIGILATLSIPYMQQAIGAAENGSAYGSMKTMLAAQTNYYSEKGRYARLDELNNSQNGSLGTSGTNSIERGRFTFQMNPPVPTDSELKEGFVIIATKSQIANEPPVVITLTHQGYTTAIY